MIRGIIVNIDAQDKHAFEAESKDIKLKITMKLIRVLHNFAKAAYAEKGRLKCFFVLADSRSKQQS